MLTDSTYLEKMEREVIEDCVELAVEGLEVYVHEREERLLQATRRDREDG